MDEIKKTENKIIKEFELLMASKDSTHLGLLLGETETYNNFSKRITRIQGLLNERKVKIGFLGGKNDE